MSLQFSMARACFFRWSASGSSRSRHVIAFPIRCWRKLTCCRKAANDSFGFVRLSCYWPQWLGPFSCSGLVLIRPGLDLLLLLEPGLARRPTWSRGVPFPASSGGHAYWSQGERVLRTPLLGGDIGLLGSPSSPPYYPRRWPRKVPRSAEQPSGFGVSPMPGGVPPPTTTNPSPIRRIS